ncbi:MAG TPA: hypothetical protein VGR82_01775 [Methylomirabilota bacterium]|nr:hypothetical protein [Methylomirabilota bacterium]
MRLREELAREGITAPVRLGGLGELSVKVDGRVVFSYKDAGRMPQPGEVARLVKGTAR